MKSKKFQYFMLAATCCLATTACSNSDEPVDRNTDLVPITLSAGLDVKLTTITRTPLEGTAIPTEGFDARVLTSSTTKDYSAAYTDGFGNSSDDLQRIKFTATATSTGFVQADGTTAGTLFYPSPKTTSVFIMGMYPYSSWTQLDDKSGWTATLAGNNDLMVAPEITATQATAVANSAPMLTFGHAGTKIIIAIKAANSTAAGRWGYVKNIEMTSVQGNPVPSVATMSTAAALTWAAPAIVPPATAVPNFPFYGMANDKVKVDPGTPLTSADYADAVFAGTNDNAPIEDNSSSDPEGKIKPIYIAYTICPPATNVNPATATNDYVLDLVVTDQLYGIPTHVTLPIDITNAPEATTGDGGNTAGQSYLCTLTFSSDAAFPTIQIEQWEDDKSYAGNVEDGELEDVTPQNP